MGRMHTIQYAHFYHSAIYFFSLVFAFGSSLSERMYKDNVAYLTEDFEMFNWNLFIILVGVVCWARLAAGAAFTVKENKKI